LVKRRLIAYADPAVEGYLTERVLEVEEIAPRLLPKANLCVQDLYRQPISG
jgi:hypothetical protein